MTKKLIILTGLFAVGLLMACSLIRKNETPLAIREFPTATNHFLFRSDTSVGTPPPNFPVSVQGTPTIASIFQTQPSGTPRLDEISTPTPELTKIQVLSSQYITVTVYQDGLNSNWEVQEDTGMDVDLNSSAEVFGGRSAISFTPRVAEGYGSLFFTVSENSQQVYPRDRAALISFWLYSGEEPLPLDQLAIAVVGSNSQPFWSADDGSVTVNDQLPLFPETRLYYLGFNHEIPADTWVPVELDLDQIRIYEPDYQYVTGFSIKTELNFCRTLMIDDISLVMLEPVSGTLPTVEPQAVLIPIPDPGNSVSVQISTQEAVRPISELIYGASGAPSDYLQALQPSLNSWGGDSSSRYNWQLGHAWNAGRDDLYRNGDHGITSGSASDEFVSQSLEAGAAARLSLPTLGWIAKDDDPDTCSFPLAGGSCGDADGASCEEPGTVADPFLANIPSYPSTVTAWLLHLVREQSFDIRFLAMDNEPELWGHTHYDVHPRCSTYNEILGQYLTYATTAHNVAPGAELVGPVTSGWYYYWNSAAGEGDKSLHGNQDFLCWFLDRLRQNDESTGWRSLHVLDLHYYPEGAYNDEVDDRTAARRLRSTRSLWDESYVDESSINEPVYLIPRMKALIEEHYPGTKLGLSEWSWGADETMNGALAIADVLGIFGREDLYYAAYWQYPPLGSPGYFAFKMYTNFDDHGGHFGDTSVAAQSADADVLGSYAALDDDSGDLHVMLVNKQADGEVLAQIELGSFVPDESVQMYRYDATHPEGITVSTIDVTAGDLSVSLPAYSITLLVLQEAK